MLGVGLGFWGEGFQLIGIWAFGVGLPGVWGGSSIYENRRITLGTNFAVRVAAVEQNLPQVVFFLFPLP